MVTDTAGNVSITALIQDSRRNRQPDSHSDFRGVTTGFSVLLSQSIHAG